VSLKPLPAAPAALVPSGGGSPLRRVRRSRVAFTNAPWKVRFGGSPLHTAPRRVQGSLPTAHLQGAQVELEWGRLARPCRLVWQITKGMAGQDALAPVVPTHAGLKDKRKVSTRKVAWSWQPFKNSARTDTLMLKHWVKTGTGGTLLPGSNGGDVGGGASHSSPARLNSGHLVHKTGPYNRSLFS